MRVPVVLRPYHQVLLPYTYGKFMSGSTLHLQSLPSPGEVLWILVAPPLGTCSSQKKQHRFRQIFAASNESAKSQDCASRVQQFLLQASASEIKEALLWKTPDHEHTSLMSAAWRGSLPVVEMLLQAGADPTATDKRGWRAADFSSRMGKPGARGRIFHLLTLASGGRRPNSGRKACAAAAHHLYQSQYSPSTFFVGDGSKSGRNANSQTAAVETHSKEPHSTTANPTDTERKAEPLAAQRSNSEEEPHPTVAHPTDTERKAEPLNDQGLNSVNSKEGKRTVAAKAEFDELQSYRSSQVHSDSSLSTKDCPPRLPATAAITLSNGTATPLVALTDTKTCADGTPLQKFTAITNKDSCSRNQFKTTKTRTRRAAPPKPILSNPLHPRSTTSPAKRDIKPKRKALPLQQSLREQKHDYNRNRNWVASRRFQHSPNHRRYNEEQEQRHDPNPRFDYQFQQQRTRRRQNQLLLEHHQRLHQQEAQKLTKAITMTSMTNLTANRNNLGNNNSSGRCNSMKQCTGMLQLKSSLSARGNARKGKQPCYIKRNPGCIEKETTQCEIRARPFETK